MLFAMPSAKPLTLDQARSQLWKAVSDNKAVHADNLLQSFPALAGGQQPPEAFPEDGTAALGWYGRVISHVPLVGRADETQALHQRALDTLEVLKKHGVPFQGEAEFADSLVTRKLIAHPSSPYGNWFIEQGLLTHEQVVGVAFGQPARRPGPRP